MLRECASGTLIIPIELFIRGNGLYRRPHVKPLGHRYKVHRAKLGSIWAAGRKFAGGAETIHAKVQKDEVVSRAGGLLHQLLPHACLLLPDILRATATGPRQQSIARSRNCGEKAGPLQIQVRSDHTRFAVQRSTMNKNKTMSLHSTVC